jgi:hypothetical protein
VGTLVVLERKYFQRLFAIVVFTIRVASIGALSRRRLVGFELSDEEEGSRFQRACGKGLFSIHVR